MKEKIIKHLQKASDEINTILTDAMASNSTVVNVDLEYMGQQIDDLINDLELIDEIEMDDDDVWDPTLSDGLDDEGLFFSDDY